jgi:hypothetical protein
VALIRDHEYSSRVPQRSTTVRFGEDLWTLLEREAAREGLSAAQYVRDAAVLRLAFAMAEQGDTQAQTTLADVATRALGRRANGDEFAERSPMARTRPPPRCSTTPCAGPRWSGPACSTARSTRRSTA